MDRKQAVESSSDERLLHFQIISVPDISCDISTVLSNLKQYVETCDIKIKNFGLLKLESEYRSYLHGADEFVVAVEGYLYHSVIISSYESLIDKWMKKPCVCTPKPVIRISDDEFFETSRILEHQTKCSHISFGILTHTNQYIYYGKLGDTLTDTYTVKFQHDIRNIKVLSLLGNKVIIS